MPITPTNQVKNAVSPVNTEKGDFYLLTENQDFLTQEDGFLLLLDGDISVLGTNQVKNAVSPTNETKS